MSALLFGLAPGGVCLAGRSPGRRWALTPPFHPYPTATLRRSSRPGGVISVALSFGSPRLGVTQRPALWSPDFPPTYSLTPAVTRPPRPRGILPRRLGLLNVLVYRPVGQRVGALVVLAIDMGNNGVVKAAQQLFRLFVEGLELGLLHPI